MPQIILEHINKRFDKFVAVDDLNLVNRRANRSRLNSRSETPAAKRATR